MARSARRWLCLFGLVWLLLAALPAAGETVDWDRQLAAGAGLPPGERIVQLSAALLGTPYQANTLGGGPQQTETLVVNLAAVDCFTLLDYVEALRRARSFAEFPAQLQAVRYRNGELAWAQRRHFFTDWAEPDQARLRDVTAEIGGARARRVTKQLNLAADGGTLLAGLPVRQRSVTYLPTALLDAGLLARLQPGDYLGIYSDQPGLDVSHVGILVRDGGRLWLRHASTRAGAVIDSDLRDYLVGRPGLVVLRAR